MNYLLAWIDIRPFIFIAGAALTCAIGGAVAFVARRKKTDALLGIKAGFIIWLIAFFVWISGQGVKRQLEFSLTYSADGSGGARWFRYEFDDHPGHYVRVPRTGVHNTVFVTDETAPQKATLTVQYTYDWSRLRSYTIVSASGFELHQPTRVRSFVWPMTSSRPPLPPAN